MAWVGLLLDVVSACWAVSHAQGQANSTEEWSGCKPAVLQTKWYWKTIKTQRVWWHETDILQDFLGYQHRICEWFSQFSSLFWKGRSWATKDNKVFLRLLENDFNNLFMIYYSSLLSLTAEPFLVHLSLLTNSFLQLTLWNPHIYFSSLPWFL